MADVFYKRALLDELVGDLTSQLETLERAHKATTDGATHEEAKPENDKDTRALEQSYLARGQAQRVEELRTSLAEVAALPIRVFRDGDRVAVGALVTVEEDEQKLVFFLAPHGGGTVLAGGVRVVTPRSPLGAALLGKQAGDDCEARVSGRVRELSVIAIA